MQLKNYLHFLSRCIAIFAILLFLASCGATASLQPSSTSTPASSSTTGNFQEYALPQSASGLMRPAIDGKGQIWFGEMGHNYLASFDPQTHIFQQTIPPGGKNGVMGIAAAQDNTIWFAEQYANYIGHYFPDTKTFKVYNLPTIQAPDANNQNSVRKIPTAPNDIALDAQGNVWFTELNSDSVGLLNTKTGTFKQYPLSAKKTIQTLNPYGIAVDPAGMVWFTESTTSSLGRLDPHTGTLHLFTPQNSDVPLMEVTVDAKGTIWATGFTHSLLLKFDPTTEAFTSYSPNLPENNTGALYGVVASHNEVWITEPAQNVIALLNTQTGHFTFYQIPTENSFPLGIVMGAQHTLWFTEAGSDKIGMFKP